MIVFERAPAKLNLALHVRGRRADGYHELETLFAFAADGDAVTVARAEVASFTITGPFAGVLSGDDDNLVTRAERAFAATFGVGETHAIVLDKHLPVASGIGGGSADAAATLRALARLHDVAVDEVRLARIAAELGADVPACLLGEATFGTARGDVLERVEGLGDMPVLLVNPGVAVSTAAVFSGWDGVDRGPIAPGAMLARAKAGRNDLQPPAEVVAPVIAEAVALLAAQPGAVLARMSGSGATCFALFEDSVARDTAAAEVARLKPDWWRMASVVR